MPPPQETKECPYCAEVILAKAIKCRYCGEMLDNTPEGSPAGDETDPSYPSRRLWSPGIAALSSLVIPGAGQMYRGKVGAGLLWLVCVPLGYILIVPGLILHVICIFNAASGDPTLDHRESVRVAVWYAAAALSLACVAGAIIYLARYQNPGNRQFDQQPLAFVPPSPTPQLDVNEQEEGMTPTPSPSVEPSAQPSVEPSAEAATVPSPAPSLSSESASSSVAVASNLPPPNPITVTDTLHSSARLTGSAQLLAEPGKNSSSAQQRYQAGVALLKQQRWAEAESELREAVRLKADNAYYHFHLGAALSPQMRFAETEAEFREAARLDPANALWRAKLGYILSVRKKWAEAEHEALEAARLDPANVGYKTLLQNIQQKK